MYTMLSTSSAVLYNLYTGLLLNEHNLIPCAAEHKMLDAQITTMNTRCRINHTTAPCAYKPRKLLMADG